MYKDKEAKELLELLEGHKTLTFQSQLDLQKELKVRGLSDQAGALNSTIVKTSTDIDNFIYLKDLGFKIEEVDNVTKISRTTQAILVDLLAIVLGVLLSLYGFVKLLSLTVFAQQSDDSFSLSTLMMIVIYGAMILIGVKFLNGVKRFFDFLGFELSKTDGRIALKKRFDLKLNEIKSDGASLRLEKYRDRMILKLDNFDLLESNANDIVQKMTIESLYQKLRN